uniref:Uncharacterized protein n=1 Tax=Phlebotomus papatasi TaxID=29031 RepID=A0A1B0D5S4_PHLPP
CLGNKDRWSSIDVTLCIDVLLQQSSPNEHKHSQKVSQATPVKYEPHAVQSQKKRLLAMAQNECFLSSSSSSSSNQLHVPKQEPTEFTYDYTQVDKRASWAAPPAHHNHHKRDTAPYISSQHPPPMAHTKNATATAAAVAAYPIYRQQHQSSNTPLGNSPLNRHRRMLLTNAVQTNSVAWPQNGRQVALVPSWPQQGAPHSLIVDSAPFLNVEEIYPKHHLNLQRHEPKKESPVHHLVVPRHDKKETNQLSPVKKRVKESTPPHQQRYNRTHISPQYHHSSHHFYSSSGSNGGMQQQLIPLQQQQAMASSTGGHHVDNGHNAGHHHHSNSHHNHGHHHGHHGSGNGGGGHNAGQAGNGNFTGGSTTNSVPKHQQTITIHDTPSPTAVITISDSEDESPDVQQAAPPSCKNTNRSHNSSSSSCRSNHVTNAPPTNQNVGTMTNATSQTALATSNRNRKNVISCVTVGDSDTEERVKSPKVIQQSSVPQHTSKSSSSNHHHSHSQTVQQIPTDLIH